MTTATTKASKTSKTTTKEKVQVSVKNPAPSANDLLAIISAFNNVGTLRPKQPALARLNDTTTSADIDANLAKLTAYHGKYEAWATDYCAWFTKQITDLSALGASVNVCAKKHLGASVARCVTALDVRDHYSGNKDSSIGRILSNFKG